MKKRDLKEWIMVLTILPTMLTGITLAAYYTVNRFAELSEVQLQTGTNLVEPLAIAAEEGLLGGNKRKLRRLIYSSHRKNTGLINNIAIYDLQRQLVLHSGNRKDLKAMELPAAQPIPSFTTAVSKENYLVFYSPVYSEFNTSAVGEAVNEELIGYVALQLIQDRAQSAQKSALLVSLALIVLGLLISVLFAIKLVNKVIRPVKTMVTAINAIGSGTGDVYIEEELTGELDLLKNGINTVAKSLNAIHLEMQLNVEQTTADLRETMEQIEIQNVELNLAKREALEANRVKSEFLANMSHELRTPLNGVIGFTRQLMKTPLKENQRDYLETIASSANSLLVIIDDILDFSKLDAGRLALENIPFAFRDSINDVLTMLAPGAFEKNLEFSARFAADVPDDLIADPNRIKQVLVNLVGNAIKFTEKGSISVDISVVKRRFDEVTLKAVVIDTGIGIQPAQQESLFAAFGQADTSITRRYGGTGLGLIISQKLAQAMQGEITLSSEVNRGSTFSFQFDCKIHSIALSPPLPVQELKQRSMLYFESLSHTRSSTCELLESWGLKLTPCGDTETLKRILKSGRIFDFALISPKVSAAFVTEVKQLITELQPVVDHIYLLVETLPEATREVLLGSGIRACLNKPLNHRKLAVSLSKSFEPFPTNSPNWQSQTAKSPLNVLAVDDNEANLKLITTLLQEQVESVEVGKNGAEAVAICNIKKFDLVFMDIQMPVMDGITACQQIQSASLNADTPIVAVTAHALAGEKERLMEVGFNGYLTKPIDEQILYKTIKQYTSESLQEQPQALLEQPQTETVSAPESTDESSTQLSLLNEPVAPTQTQTAETAPSSDATDEFKPQSARVDWDMALQHAANKPDLAVDMLMMLLDSIPAAREAIDKATEAEDSAEILKHVHKLHGACCYTGVPRLKKLANMIETHIKKHQNADDVIPELYELIDEMDNLVIDCQSWQAKHTTTS